MKTLFTFFIMILAVNNIALSQNREELKNLVNQYFQNEYYEIAIINCQKLLEITITECGESSDESADIMNLLGILYDQSGDYVTALPYLKKACELRKNLFGETDKELTEYLNNLAGVYISLGEYQEASKILTPLLEVRKRLFGEESFEYGNTLSHIGLLYSTLKLFKEAEYYYKKSAQIFFEIGGKESENYIGSINGLARALSEQGFNDTASVLYENLINDYKKSGKTNIIQYAVLLNNYSIHLLDNGDLDRAESYLLESLVIVENTIGKKSEQYATYLNNLAGIYYYKGDTKKTEEYLLKTKELTKETMGEKSKGYLDILDNLGPFYYLTANYPNAIPYFTESMNYYIYLVNNAYTFLSEPEKENVNSKIKVKFKTYFSLAHHYNKEGNYLTDLFNFRLLTKGIILQSVCQIRNRILNSKKPLLIESYNEYVQLKDSLYKSYNIPVQQRKETGINTEVMEKQINDMEKELANSSSDFANSIIEKSVTFDHLKNSLDDKTALIEFVDFNLMKDHSTDTILYYAFIVKKNSEHPEFVYLCEEASLLDHLILPPEAKRSHINDYTENSLVYNLIWAPLEKHLENIDNIYLSASGLLYKVSFSSLKVKSDELLCDKYSIHYLNNLKDYLFMGDTNMYEKPEKEISTAIFGGADYNKDFKPDTENNIFFKYGWKYLPGSLIESENISSILLGNKVISKSFTGLEASEKNFRDLQTSDENKSPDIIHLATHSFIFQKVINKSSGFPDIGFNRTRYLQNPLMRVGLVFSGANNYWLSGNTINENDDGILTAYEIANLDFSGTKLIVLSACESGLGDIRSGEGVYGLQRAFYISGVKTFIMSLWKIPDNETNELMKYFYLNISNGFSVYQSLTNAQNEIRKNYPPYYWAGFILSGM